MGPECLFSLCYVVSSSNVMSLSFRHEMPTDPNDPLANQNIKDRFYGANDPVADKLLQRAATMPKLEPPTDRTVMTLYVGGLDGRVTDQDLRYGFNFHFYA